MVLILSHNLADLSTPSTGLGPGSSRNTAQRRFFASYGL